MDVHVAVRLVHTLGMGVLLGGALVVAMARDPRAAAVPYEWAFWIAMGVQVATGVGNVGALGDPGLATRWGLTFAWKLGLVVALLLASAARALALPRMGPRAMRVWYGATAAGIAAIGGVAVVLAHG